LPVLRISSTTSPLYSGEKNRRGRGTWTPISRAKPSAWVSTRPGQLQVGESPVLQGGCPDRPPRPGRRLPYPLDGLPRRERQGGRHTACG
jgi:hypothetical protein